MCNRPRAPVLPIIIVTSRPVGQRGVGVIASRTGFVGSPIPTLSSRDAIVIIDIVIRAQLITHRSRTDTKRFAGCLFLFFFHIRYVQIVSLRLRFRNAHVVHPLHVDDARRRCACTTELLLNLTGYYNT